MNSGLLFLLAACWVPVLAVESPALRLESVTSIVRPGHLVRATLRADDMSRDPVQVAIALLQGNQQVARADLDLDDGRRLTAGVVAVLTQTTAIDGTGPRLHLVATLSRNGQLFRQVQHDIDSLAHLRAEFLALDNAFGVTTDALPALWLEQAAERVLAEPTLRICADLAAVCRDLAAWQRGNRTVSTGPGRHLLALRDPVDGSVQPLRVHRPLPPATGPTALWLSDPPQASKGDWPLPPALEIAPLLAAGWTVIEAYPAGDASWSGCAPRRALLTWQAAGQDGPAIVIGHRRSAHAALLLAEQAPSTIAGVVIIDGQMPRPPAAVDGDVQLAQAWATRHGGNRPARLTGIPVVVTGTTDALLTGWLAAAQAAGVSLTTDVDWLTTFLPQVGTMPPQPRLRAPLPGIDAGPVAIVVGTGEHVAAAEANRVLADAVVRAWSEHAHAAPAVHTDAIDVDLLADHHLICIGSPRSHRILAHLIERGLDPHAQWDERTIQIGGTAWLRAERRPLAIRRPRPERPGRVVVILDGGPSWAPGSLPGTDWADLLIGGGTAGVPPVRRWFDSDWR